MTKLSTQMRIIEKADQLFYQQGFEHTSFAHIAEAVAISRGNFYHHFKSKDQILAAVIKYRLNKTQSMLDDWQTQETSPIKRIQCFINILIMNQARIKLYGCPVGTLSGELVKLEHQLLDKANQIFTLFRDWLSQQFKLLGYQSNSDELAMHLLARSQGIATLASAFRDENFIHKEVKELNCWLKQLKQVNRC